VFTSRATKCLLHGSKNIGNRFCSLTAERVQQEGLQALRQMGMGSPN
jgi:hypothetical protein